MLKKKTKMYQFKIPVEDIEKVTLTLSFLGVENYSLFENENSPKSEFYDADSFPIAQEFLLETDEHIEELKKLGFEYQVIEPAPYLEEKPQPIAIGSFVINPDANPLGRNDARMDCVIAGGAKCDVATDKHISIFLEGAMAFGTGHHQTTKLCLLGIEDLKDKDIQSVLDLGCGTGVLAIAAQKVLHPKVLHASDIDPVAIDISAHNLQINDLTLVIPSEAEGSSSNNAGSFSPTCIRITGAVDVKLFLSEGFQNIPNRSYDLIIANILLNPLCAMAVEMIKHTSKYLILSGIIDSQKEELLSAFKGCAVVKEYQLDEWCAIILRVT